MPRASVSSVNSHDLGDRTVTLHCNVSVDDRPGEYALPDAVLPVELRFFAPDVFRFEFNAIPEATSPSRSDADFDTDALREPVDLTASESDGELRIDTGELAIVVGLEEWSFAVETAGGRRLFADQDEDLDAKSQQLTDPIGFTAEPVNRWPYRCTDAGGSFTLGPDEHVYGFGEQFTGFDKRGQTVEAWVTQANGTNSRHAYKNVPFYLSTAGYGLLVDTDCRTTFDVGHTGTSTLEIAVDDDTFSFFFFANEGFEAILEAYTRLTGRPPRPPKWSFGVWMSRCGYQSRETVEDVLDGLDARDVPCDVVHLDPPWLNDLCDLEWDRDAFPDPEGFVADLHDRGVRLSLWEYPYLLARTDAFDEARDAGYLVEDGTGDPYVVLRLSWAGDRAGIVDFTNPEAVEWWREKHQPLLDMGVDVFKTDFGEYLPTDAVMHDRTSGRATRNRYPNLYTETVYRTLEAAAGDDAVIWARSGWTGGQQYPVHWGGDPSTTFGAMASSLRGGLSLCLSGYGFWSADIGGFRGEPTPELYVRWAAFGLLGNSHARFHGTTPREPWHFGESAVDAVREFARERYRLIPYLYTAAEITSRRGLPVMRPLVLEFQDDHGARTCGDELMMGEALLVAPVFDADGQRDVYLPDADWVDYWTGERVSGGRTIRRDVALDDIPVYLRAGHLVARQDPDRGVADGTPESLELYGALTDGEAIGGVYDEDADELRSPGVALEGADLLVTPDGLTVERVIVRAVASGDVPATVTVDDETLSRVDADPAAGEWAYDLDDETLVVRP